MAAEVEVPTAEVRRAVSGGRLHLSPLTDSSNKGLLEIPSVNQSHIITPEPTKPVPGPKPRLSPKPFAVEKNTTIKPILAPKPQTKPRPESTRIPGYKPELQFSQKPQPPAVVNKPKPVSSTTNRPPSTSFRTSTTLNSGQTTKPVAQPFKPAPILDPIEPRKPTVPLPAERQKPSSLTYSRSLKSPTATEWTGSTKKDQREDLTSGKGGASITRTKSLGFLAQLELEEEEEREKTTSDETAVTLRPHPRGSRPRPVSAIYLASPTKTDAPVPAPRWAARRPLSADLTAKFESIGLSLHRSSAKSNTKENTPEERLRSLSQSSDNVAKLAEADRLIIPKTQRKSVNESGDNKHAGSIKSRISLLLDSSASPSSAVGEQMADLRSPGHDKETPVGVKQLIKQLTVDASATHPTPNPKPALKPRPLPLDLTKKFSERSPDLGSVFFSELTEGHEFSKDPQRRTEDLPVSPSEQKTLGPGFGLQLGSTPNETGLISDAPQMVRASMFDNVIEKHSVTMVDDGTAVVNSSNNQSFKKEKSEDDGTLVTATYREPVSPSSPLWISHAKDSLQALEAATAVSESVPTAQWDDKAMTLRTRQSEELRLSAAKADTEDHQHRYLRIGSLQKWTNSGLDPQSDKENGLPKTTQRKDLPSSKSGLQEAELEGIAAAPKRLKIFPQEDTPKPRATYFALTGQIQEPCSPVDGNMDDMVFPNQRNTFMDADIPSPNQVKDFQVRESSKTKVVKGVQAADNLPEKKNEPKFSERFLKSVLEREKQTQLDIEKQADLEFARMKERELQREFERQRQISYEKEKQAFEEKRVMEKEKQLDLEKQMLQDLEQKRLEKESLMVFDKEAKRRELERQRAEEQQREEARKREMARQIELQRQRMEELHREEAKLRELARQTELERQRMEELQREEAKQKELARQSELERQRMEELQREEAKQKELARQRELQRQRMEELQREEAKQRELARQRELERQRMEELQREEAKQRELARQRDLERQRMEELQREEAKQRELARQRELERQRMEELQREEAKQRELARQRELERQGMEELQREEAKQRELARQRELERLRTEERQRELDKQRAVEKEAQLVLERQREKERQKELDRQKREIRQKEVERQRHKDLDKERQLEVEKEKQRLDDLERIKELETIQLFEFRKQKEKERQMLLELEKQTVEEKNEQEKAERIKRVSLEHEMLRLKDLDRERDRRREEHQREMEQERQRALERQRQKDLEKERQKKMDIERLELENQRLRQLELDKERRMKEELEIMKEMEKRQLLEFEKQKQAVKDKNNSLEMEKKEAEKMRQIARQQEAERQRRKEKQKKEEQERIKLESTPLRPKVVDLDSVFQTESLFKVSPQRSDPSTRWKEPSPRLDKSYKPAILDVDSFTSHSPPSSTMDPFLVSSNQNLDRGLDSKLQPAPGRDLSWKLPPSTTSGFSSPVWTQSPQDPWELRPFHMSADTSVTDSRPTANKPSPELLLLQQEERRHSPQRQPSAADPLFLTSYDGTEAKPVDSPFGVATSSNAEIWFLREPQRSASREELRSHRRSQASQELNRIRSRSVSRRSAPSSSALEGMLPRMRSRSSHREHDRQSFVQQKQSAGEEEGKDPETPLRDSDSQYGTWETGLRTDDSLTPATPSSDTTLSPSPKKPTPVPSERTALLSTNTLDGVSSENQPLPFPEAPTILLDTSALRSRAQLGKKRAARTRPTRAARQKAAVEEPRDIEDWLYRDSTEEKVNTKKEESDSEEQSKGGADVSPAAVSQPQRVALFPGVDPSALKVQLKKRGDTDTQTDSPSQASRSPKSPFLPRAARVLPPPGGKENGEESSPQWLKELKSKKRLSQYETES